MKNKEYRLTSEWPYHVSCGGIIYRKNDNDEIETLVLVKHDGGYDIPKGTLKYGETLEDCALREALEESGQKCEIAGYLGGRLDEGFDDNNNATISKVTHYFAIRWQEDSGSHDDEYSGIEWVPLDKFLETLNKPSSNEVIERFIRFTEKFAQEV